MSRPLSQDHVHLGIGGYPVRAWASTSPTPQLHSQARAPRQRVDSGKPRRCGPGIAIGQDHVRRVVLKEKDKPGGANIGLKDLVTRYALDQGYTTVLEGIFYAGSLRCDADWAPR